MTGTFESPLQNDLDQAEREISRFSPLAGIGVGTAVACITRAVRQGQEIAVNGNLGIC